MPRYTTFSSKETKNLARKFAERLSALPAAGRTRILLLRGDLGSGKTTFVQGFLRELGVTRNMTSPTFVLMKQYRLRTKKGGYTRAYHIDAYRLGNGSLPEYISIREITRRDSSAIVLIEWPERIARAIPRAKKKSIIFSHGSKENKRHILLPALGKAMVPRTRKRR